MSTRALVSIPRNIKAGDIIDVRATLQHAMETGFRVDTVGRVLPRDIVRRVEAHFDDQGVFAMDLHPAISANPYVAFSLRVARTGTLRVTWRGDKNFSHTEIVAIAVG